MLVCEVLFLWYSIFEIFFGGVICECGESESEMVFGVVKLVMLLQVGIVVVIVLFLFVCYMGQYNKYVERYGFLVEIFIERRIYNNFKGIDVDGILLKLGNYFGDLQKQSRLFVKVVVDVGFRVWKILVMWLQFLVKLVGDRKDCISVMVKRMKGMCMELF